MNLADQEIEDLCDRWGRARFIYVNNKALWDLERDYKSKVMKLLPESSRPDMDIEWKVFRAYRRQQDRDVFSRRS